MKNSNLGLIDFHSHILPGIDDGSDSLETSLKMLEVSKNQGVTTIVSTSHYYNFRESTSKFISRRDEALFKLERHIKEYDLDLPEIVPAAEVRLFPEMHSDKNLSKLCIGNTKNLLLEMPYSQWSPWMYNEVYTLITMGYTPILAHIERFVTAIPEKDILSKLLSMDVYVQCNSESFEDRKMRKFIKKLIKLGKLTVIGSDFHNLDTRISKIDDACGYLEKKYGKELVESLMNNADYLINN